MKSRIRRITHREVSYPSKDKKDRSRGLLTTVASADMTTIHKKRIKEPPLKYTNTTFRTKIKSPALCTG